MPRPIHLFAAQVGNSNEWTRNIAFWRKGDRVNIDRLVVGSEVRGYTNQKWNALELDSVVIRKLFNSFLDPSDRVFMSLATNDPIPALSTVGNLLQMLGLRIQIVYIE